MSESLAIHGESPVRKKLLPYGQQWIDEYDIKSVVDVLRGDWITQGPKINEFEKKKSLITVRPNTQLRTPQELQRSMLLVLRRGSQRVLK